MKSEFTRRIVKRLKKEVALAQKLNNFKLFRLAKALLMVAHGQSTAEFAEFFNVSTRNVLNWLHRFMVESFPWFIGHHYQGRGRKTETDKSTAGGTL